MPRFTYRSSISSSNIWASPYRIGLSMNGEISSSYDIPLAVARFHDL